MNALYILATIAVVSFLPTNLAERLKPGDPYLFVLLAVIAKAFVDRRKEFIEGLLSVKTALLAVIASYLLSALFSEYISDSLKFTARFFILLLFAVAVSALTSSRKEVVVVLSWLMAFGFLTGLYAVYQILNPPPVIAGLSAVEGISNVRVFSTFFNANIYAEFLLVCISVGMGLFMHAASKRTKAVFLFLVVFLSVILFYTYSRGSLLGIAASLFVFFLLTYPGLLPPVLALLAIFSSVVPGFMSRIIATLTFSDSSQFVRLRIWNTAFSYMDSAKKYLVGAGPYSFKYEVMDFVRKSPERFFGYFSFQPHNIYLLWLFEGGIIMLASWIYYFAYHIYMGVRSFIAEVENGRNRFGYIVASLIAASAGLLINGATETIFYHNQVLPLWFLVNGLILWSYRNSLKEAEGS